MLGIRFSCTLRRLKSLTNVHDNCGRNKDARVEKVVQGVQTGIPEQGIAEQIITNEVIVGLRAQTGCGCTGKGAALQCLCTLYLVGDSK